MLKQKRGNQKVFPLKNNLTKRMLEVGIQPGKLSALRAAASPFKTEEQARNSCNEDDNVMEEADMKFLRKIDFYSFIAFLIVFIFFNSYYWADMICG